MKVMLSLKLSSCIKASSPASKSKEDIYFFETKPALTVKVRDISEQNRKIKRQKTHNKQENEKKKYR